MNAEAAEVLVRLTAATGKPEFRDRARDILTAHAATYSRQGLGAADYVRALRIFVDTKSTRS